MTASKGYITHSPARDLRDDPWQNDAACRDAEPEMFNPDRGRSESTRDHADRVTEALRVCRQDCPVVAACLAANLDDPWLIVGGTTPQQRAALRKKARRKPKPAGVTVAKCPKGHDTSTPGARYADRSCKQCRRDRANNRGAA